jgi:hypothetical protein
MTGNVSFVRCYIPGEICAKVIFILLQKGIFTRGSASKGGNRSTMLSDFNLFEAKFVHYLSGGSLLPHAVRQPH